MNSSTTRSDAAPVPSDPHHWFRQEVHPHDAQLKAYLRNAFPAVRNVDDVVQESYLRIWRRQLGEPIASAKSFLFQIARRLALNSLRHDRVSPVDERATDVDALAIAIDGDLRDTLCTRQEVDLLLDAIEELPRRSREIIFLRKIEGLSQKEIARKLQISENTVGVHFTRGFKRLQMILHERGLVKPE